MWPIISISACLPFSNSYCVLIGPCLAGEVLNSSYIRMASLSYSKLQDAALIKRLLVLVIPAPPPPPCLPFFFFFLTFNNPRLIIQHSKVNLDFHWKTSRCSNTDLV